MKRLLAIILTAASLCLAACGKDGTAYTVYHKNADGDRLIPETRRIDEGATVEETIASLIGFLSASPKTEGALNVLPTDVKLLGASVENGTATVNLSDAYYGNKGVDELLSRVAIANTLCGIDGVDEVLIKIDGKPLVSSTTGAQIGPISSGDIANGFQDKAVVDKETVVLYFPDENGEYLVPERREIELQASISVERVIISELAKGPATEGLVRVIPSDVNLISIETTDGVCFVNLSGDFVSSVASSSASTTMALYSIVNSLTELDGISSVQVLIDGKTGVEFGNYVLDVPLAKNQTLIKE